MYFSIKKLYSRASYTQLVGLFNFIIMDFEMNSNLRLSKSPTTAWSV
jgi:hypothetical protein